MKRESLTYAAGTILWGRSPICRAARARKVRRIYEFLRNFEWSVRGGRVDGPGHSVSVIDVCAAISQSGTARGAVGLRISWHARGPRPRYRDFPDGGRLPRADLAFNVF